MRLTRRALVQAGVLTAASPMLNAFSGRGAVAQGAAPAASPAGEPAWRHGLSLFGDIKYPAGFKHFDYVNPAAPKGGTVRLGVSGQTFDNFNRVIAGVKGNLAAGVTLLHDTLLVEALDEVSTEYGLLAESVNYPDDFSWVVYRLR
ncbi:MAG TPA: ABC transporter substrate-binding protein, partial [Acidisoma sp.]|nr:ABC transporter substrate-binding protein [Acidisoma sp.]